MTSSMTYEDMCIVLIWSCSETYFFFAQWVTWFPPDWKHCVYSMFIQRIKLGLGTELDSVLHSMRARVYTVTQYIHTDIELHTMRSRTYKGLHSMCTRAYTVTQYVHTGIQSYKLLAQGLAKRHTVCAHGHTYFKKRVRTRTYTESPSVCTLSYTQ